MPNSRKAASKKLRANLHGSTAKNDNCFKSIRTKKMKRYEKYLEPKGIRKFVTEPENEFMGLENIAS